MLFLRSYREKKLETAKGEFVIALERLRQRLSEVEARTAELERRCQTWRDLKNGEVPKLEERLLQQHRFMRQNIVEGIGCLDLLSRSGAFKRLSDYKKAMRAIQAAMDGEPIVRLYYEKHIHTDASNDAK